MNADLDFRFEGQTYHIAPLSDKGRRWLAAKGLSEIVPTVGINKIRQNAKAAGLRTLVDGNDWPNYSLLEDAEALRRLEEKAQRRAEAAATYRPARIPPIAKLGEIMRTMDRVLVQGALAAPGERCPYKRNTREGKELAARWEEGRAMAAELRR
jgi:hypothetical protein